MNQTPKNFLTCLTFIIGLPLLVTTNLFSSPAPLKKLCVQTFNVYGPIYSRKRPERAEAFVKELNKLQKCDILHLQEVWLPRHTQFLQSSLEGHHLIFHQPTSDNIGLFSSTFLQTFQHQTHYYRTNSQVLNPLDWVRDWIGIGKGFGYFKARWNQKTIHNYNTHLHPTSADIRGHQLLQLQKHIANLPSTDIIILAGDFNASSLSPEVQEFIQQTHLEVVPTNGCTYCDSNPHHWGGGSRTIDLILYRNLQLVDAAINLQTSENLYLSDHYGVRAWFEEI